MSYNIIPLTTDPNQNFTCTVPVDGKNITFLFRFRYNTEAGYWFMSLTDISGKILLDSIPLLSSDFPAADILEQFEYLGIGSAVVVKIGSMLDSMPNDTNLGTEFLLLWGDTVG